MAKSRGWCFTIHQCSNESEEQIKSLNCTYIIVGDENAPLTGKRHWQGYVFWSCARHFNAVLGMLPKGSHLEAAKGSAKQNKLYCSKEAVLFEHGELPIQGKRNDLSMIRECVQDGGNMRDVIETASSGVGLRAGEKILQFCERRRDWEPEVFWYWGLTGAGKSRAAAALCPNAWWSGRDLRWWQGYDGHEDVIIDDFRGDFCTFHELLRILDRYPCTIETKGGSRQLLAKRIIITCPVRPEMAYKGCGEHMCQLLRRITVIKEFDSPQEGDSLARKSGVILNPDFN